MKMINRIKNKTHNIFIDSKKKIYSNTFCLIRDPYTIFQDYYILKEENYEVVKLPDIYKVRRNACFEAFSKKISILEINNATVFKGSDIVITSKGAILEKLNDFNYSKNIMLDSNLVRNTKKGLEIYIPKETVQITGRCISLLGVFDTIWAHFEVQIFPRLIFADIADLLEDNISILVPKYTDNHIAITINNYLKDKNVTIIEVENDTNYCCEKFYYIPLTAQYPNHTNYLLSSDCVIPKITKDAIYKGLVHSADITNNNNIKEYDKIYLPRNENVGRTLLNGKSIENEFIKLGFKVIEPHKLSYDEKIFIFSNAKIIVGPYSAAFTNLYWCNNAKALIISNLMRTSESYYEVPKVKSLWVTGEDEEPNNPHSSFYVPLNKILSTYEYLLLEKDIEED